MPQIRDRTGERKWEFAGRERQAAEYANELLDEGYNMIRTYDLAVKAFPDCRAYLQWDLLDGAERSAFSENPRSENPQPKEI